jgi:hypothetical protein
LHEQLLPATLQLKVDPPATAQEPPLQFSVQHSEPAPQVCPVSLHLVLEHLPPTHWLVQHSRFPEQFSPAFLQKPC